jgi:hypothetical protein
MKTTYKRVTNDFPLITPSKNTPSESILYELDTPYHPEKPFSRFYLQCYQCGIIANLGDHDQVDVINGVVTISPSILCPRESCKAHYFIKNGEIAT